MHHHYITDQKLYLQIQNDLKTLKLQLSHVSSFRTTKFQMSQMLQLAKNGSAVGKSQRFSLLLI